MMRKPNTTCAVCQKEMYRRPAQIAAGQVFCSLSCSGVSQRIQKICPVCDLPYVGNKRTCSRVCANKTREGRTYTAERKFDKAHAGTQLKKKVALARGGICERCKENNYAILQVHHIHERYRGGKDDLHNLELLCPNCHATHHLGHSLFKG